MAILASDIITASRTTSDLKQSQFLVDDPDLLGFLNDLLSELYDKFVIEKEGYFQTIGATLTFTGNLAPLPADFYKETSVYSGSIGSRCIVDPLDTWEERFRKCGFWIMARNIMVFPENVAVASPMFIDYVPSCPVLAIGTAIPVELEKFTEWLKVGLAIKIKSARNQDYSLLQKTFDRLNDRIKKMATARKSSPKVPAIPSEVGRYTNRLYSGFGFNQGGAVAAISDIAVVSPLQTTGGSSPILSINPLAYQPLDAELTAIAGLT
jgi:hypothetical protein